MSIQNNVLVSIIMPNFNCAEFIEMSIESVLSQTYENWELIIVDDCSSDSSLVKICTYSNKDSRIKIIKNDRNSGTAVSRNVAIEKAKGDYIAFLDSDDIWAPQKLEKQLEFMVNNDFDFSYTNYRLIDESGQDLNICVTGPDVVTRRMMYRSNYVGCLTVMYNSKKLGKFYVLDSIKKRNDHAIWMQIVRKTNCYLLNEELASYRKGRKGSLATNSIMSLLKHHYILYRKSEHFSPLKSFLYVLMNIGFGYIRKKIYIRKGY